MHRRDLLRMFTVAAVSPALSPELFAMLREAQPASGYALRTLTQHQNETVVAMIDLILPATDTPGAKGARVNEFMDVILTEWANSGERDHFLSGLAGVDVQTNTLFGKDFAATSIAQQTALLRSMDDSIHWTADTHHHGSVPLKDRDNHLGGEFFKVFKTMTLHGYYTSEIGFTQELKLEIIPGAYHGCVPIADAKKA